jgi:hypothetical protein
VSFLLAVSVIAGSVVFLNLAFIALSTLYFGSHTTFVVNVGEIPAYTDDQILHIRIAFATFTLVVGGAAVAATAWRREVGHLLAMVMGVGSFAAGAVAASRGMAGSLYYALFVVGLLMPYLAYRSWNGSRAAWSFLIAICSVYAVVLFFGAPTVHRVLDIGLWTTLILPGINLVSFVSLIQIRRNYQE